MMRWTISDPVVGDTYRFERNPNVMSSTMQPHRTTSHRASPIDGKIRAMRGPDLPFAWQFSGKVRSELEHKHLLDWAGRQNRVRITDHLGRQHEVLVQAFEATPVDKSGSANDWLFTYTVKTLYFRRLA